jgi:MFS family permease
MFTAVDVIQSSSQLLASPGPYGFTNKQATFINTNSMTIGAIVSIPALLFGGIFYDLLGRKKTVVILFLLCAVTCAPLPFGALLAANSSKIAYYTFFKVMFNSCVVPLI